MIIMGSGPRCLVCGALLGLGAYKEVCSYECFTIYMTEDGVTEECENCGYKHRLINCPYLKEAK